MTTEITEGIIQCVIRVHRALGPGFVEAIYRRALVIELRRRGLKVEVEKEVFVYYDGHRVGHHRLDLLVQGQVIVELKTVESLGRAHYAQVRSYLRATCLETALLINFSTPKADFRRIESPLLSPLSSPHPPEVDVSPTRSPEETRSPDRQ